MLHVERIKHSIFTFTLKTLLSFINSNKGLASVMARWASNTPIIYFDDCSLCLHKLLHSKILISSTPDIKFMCSLLYKQPL